MGEHEKKDAAPLLRCTQRPQRAVIKRAIRCSVERFHANTHIHTHTHGEGTASLECSCFPSK